MRQMFVFFSSSLVTLPLSNQSQSDKVVVFDTQFKTNALKAEEQT